MAKLEAHKTKQRLAFVAVRFEMTHHLAVLTPQVSVLARLSVHLFIVVHNQILNELAQVTHRPVGCIVAVHCNELGTKLVRQLDQNRGVYERVQLGVVPKGPDHSLSFGQQHQQLLHMAHIAGLDVQPSEDYLQSSGNLVLSQIVAAVFGSVAILETTFAEVRLIEYRIVNGCEMKRSNTNSPFVPNNRHTDDLFAYSSDKICHRFDRVSQARWTPLPLENVPEPDAV